MVNTNIPVDTHQFYSGTTLEKVLDIYIFDRELRLLLLDAIERIEISFRTRWANILALKYGAFAHENTDIFNKQTTWQIGIDELKKEYSRSQETFAEHYRQKYPTLSSPPIWTSCEMMMLGQLSRWFKNLKFPKDRQTIADIYELDERVLASFMHHLTVVRNHCAHHCRTWNRKFSLIMQLPHKKPPTLLENFNLQKTKYIYNTITMLAYLFTKISPASNWQRKIMELINNKPNIKPESMGFPIDWRQRPIWKDSI